MFCGTGPALQVNLSHNRLGPQAGVAIGRALEDNTVLECLNIDNNPVGLAGTISLVGLNYYYIITYHWQG